MATNRGSNNTRCLSLSLTLSLLIPLLTSSPHHPSHPPTLAAAASTNSSPSIPRSTNVRSIDPDRPSSSSSSRSKHSLPPWNLSPKIDADGFLTSSYCCVPGEWESEANIGGRHVSLDQPVRVRQVPGDGNCLFHSITVSMAAVVNGTHIDMAGAASGRRTRRMRRNARCLDDDEEDDYDDDDYDETFGLRHLHHHSTLLRQRAVDVLSLDPRRLLFLQGNEYLRARDLVDAAAAQYDLNGEEYCDLMRKESYWGGGPEIVALCNVLRRPIHVYELTGGVPEDENTKETGGEDNDEGTTSIMTPSNNNNNPCQFRLRRMACFGSPKFDRREPLHILSADSRFPDVKPGEQLTSGNHFLALFPDERMRAMEEASSRRHERRKKNRKKKKNGTGWGSRKKRGAGVRGGDNGRGGAFHKGMERRRVDVWKWLVGR